MDGKTYDCVIVGAGPAGIFAALKLTAREKGMRVLIVDSGPHIDRRNCPARSTGHCAKCQPCAILHGWSGAGAFSDGKLSLSPDVGGRILDYMTRSEATGLIEYVDGQYVAFGAADVVHGTGPEADALEYEASRHNIQLIRCPVRHLGTDHACEVLRSMYVELSSRPGFTFQPMTTARDLLVEGGRVRGLRIAGEGEKPATVYAGYIIAAPGRCGAQWLTDVCRAHGIETVSNEVDIGVRVEVPNAVMDHLTRHLYEAKLVYYSDTFENRVRTFCMNPGGVVSGEYYEGGIAVVNGHSYNEPERRTANTNFALLVSTRFTEPFDQPIDYGKYIAQLGNMLTGGGVMIQRWGDLMMGRRTTWSRLQKSTTIPTYPAAVPGDLSFVLPQRHMTSIIEAMRAFDKLAPGLVSRNTLLYGVEVKFYSSKVQVDSSFETAIPGFYAVGDGAGVTRGLMQASVTGVVAARSILGNRPERAARPDHEANGGATCQA